MSPQGLQSRNRPLRFGLKIRNLSDLHMRELPGSVGPVNPDAGNGSQWTLETQTNMRTPQIACKPDCIKKVCGNFLIWFRGVPI